MGSSTLRRRSSSMCRALSNDRREFSTIVANVEQSSRISNNASRIVNNRRALSAGVAGHGNDCQLKVTHSKWLIAPGYSNFGTCTVKNHILVESLAIVGNRREFPTIVAHCQRSSRTVNDRRALSTIVAHCQQSSTVENGSKKIRRAFI